MKKAANIVSNFKDKPHYKQSWKALWYGLASVGAFFVFGLIGMITALVFGGSVPVLGGFFGVALTLVTAIIALVYGIKALRAGERSWAVWLGLVPAGLAATFWVFMIIGEILIPH